ncbi:MAG: apolipoprotein N-acyltransferase, partial [Spirochaetia bacterium]|nr:apolipoprotein N-acyltransferase [Spirochaetia bacterium]
KSRLAFIATGFIWSCSELGRSVGFLAFPYGTLPYAFVESRAALWLSSIGGVALVGLTITLANVSLFASIRRLSGPTQGKVLGASARASFGIACMVLTLVFGHPDKPDTLPSFMHPIVATDETGAKEGYFRVALVQACVYKQKSVPDYDNAFTRLATLSDEVLAQKPDLVVWHETAIVPPIEWHLRHRPDRATYEFIRKVDEYLKAYPVAILTGNGYAQADDVSRSLEHNSALLYDGGSISGRYDKVMLVPFSEYMPVWARVPVLNPWVISNFGNYWTPGSGPRLLQTGQASFAAPICFEDSFGRYFSSFKSPDFFVVLTNDSWAHSAYMQKQHLAMSQFRAAETGAIVLRSADTGSTSAIAANGAVVQALEPFKPGVLVVDLPLGSAYQTVYEKIGNAVDIAILGIALALSLVTIIISRKVFRIDKNDSI